MTDRRLLAGLFWTRRKVVQERMRQFEDLAAKMIEAAFPRTAGL